MIYYGFLCPYFQKIRRHFSRRLPTKRQTDMKKKTPLLLVPIALSAALFLGYRAWDGLQTDRIPPQITIGEESLQVSVSDPKSALLQGITAQDDRDGDVTDSLLVESISMLDSDGTVEVRFAAFDQSGNVSKQTRVVHYSDYQGPRFSLNRPLLFVHSSSFDPLDAIGATDPLDGNIQHRIRAISKDSTAVTTLGSHELEFRVTNSLGDTIRLTLPVEVYSANTYGLSVDLKEYLIYLKTGSSFNARSYLSQVHRAANTISLENGTPADYSLRIVDEVNTNVPGVYPVDYYVTHTQLTNGGTQYTTGFSRLIVIVED